MNVFQLIAKKADPRGYLHCKKCNKSVDIFEAHDGLEATRVIYTCHGETREISVPNETTLRVSLPLEVFCE